MAFRIIIFLTSLLSFGAGCQSYPVSGNIDFAGSNFQRTVYLLEAKTFSSLVSSFEGKVIDSALVDTKGNFSFDKMPDIEGQNIYLLAVQKKGEKYVSRLENENPLQSNYLPFLYAPGSEVVIRSKASSMLHEYNVTSDIPENKVLGNLSRKRVEVHQQYFSTPEDFDAERVLEIEAAKSSFQQALLDLVEGQQNVYVNALALRWCSPSGDYERLADVLSGTCKNLVHHAPDHPWTAQICATSQKLPRVVGDSFPDVFLPMLQGDTVSVYKLLSSKLTLIDLWASWCAPCRKENKDVLVPLWDQYNQKGFGIVGYALDASDKGWRNAIQNDGADRWLHASHLKGDDSPVFDMLKMTTIPANYLLNKEGIIVAKNLHGNVLKTFVEKYMD